MPFILNPPYGRFYGKSLSETGHLFGGKVSWNYVSGGEQAIGEGFHALTYEKGNERVVVFEGTDRGIDWLNQNLAKFFSQRTGRQSTDTLEFLIENKEIDNWIAKGKKITFVGHSLGGGLAKIAGALVENSKVITFNTAGIGKTMRNIIGEDNLKDANIVNVRIKGDNIVSSREKYADHTITLHSELNPKDHAIETVIAELAEVSFLVRQRADKQNQLPDTNDLQSKLTGDTNAGNSCIVAASAFDQPPILTVKNSEQRVYDNANLGNNVREMVYTDGVILQSPVNIVLSWGANPADLDSHLTGPLTNGGRFHINFQEQGGLESGPNALLHRDDITHAPGGNNLPEQTRINTLNEGIYRFYVHDFTNRGDINSRALANSGAEVSFHNAGAASNIEGQGIGDGFATGSVPADGVGNTWHAFDLDSRTGVLEFQDDFQDVSEVSQVPFAERN